MEEIDTHLILLAKNCRLGFFVCLTFFFVLVVQHRVSLCSFGCPGTNLDGFSQLTFLLHDEK